MRQGIKLGAVAWGLPGGGAFAPMVAKQAGLDGIQLELGSYEEGFPLTQKEVIKGYQQAKEEYQIEYPAIVLNDVMEHEYINGRNNPNGEIAYIQIALGVEAADQLGIKKIMIPNFLKNLITEERHIVHTMEALAYACDLAEPLGIDILTENALDWKAQIGLLNDLNRANLKIHFDTQNFKFNFDMDQCEQLEHLYPYMDAQIHVKDGINAPGESLLGQGNTDFFKQMEFLNQQGFEGWVITENYYNLQPLREQATDGQQMALLQQDIETFRRCFPSY